jgi:hypothetical protein
MAESTGSMSTVVVLPCVPHTRPNWYGTSTRIVLPSADTESTPPESCTMRRSESITFMAPRAMVRAARRFVSPS